MLPILSGEEFLKKVKFGQSIFVVQKPSVDSRPIITKGTLVNIAEETEKLKNRTLQTKVVTLMFSPEEFTGTRSTVFGTLKNSRFSDLFCLDIFAVFLSIEDASTWIQMRELEYERAHICKKCALQY